MLAPCRTPGRESGQCRRRQASSANSRLTSGVTATAWAKAVIGLGECGLPVAEPNLSSPLGTAIAATILIAGLASSPLRPYGYP